MPESAGLMRGKRGLILGVANNRSIAWGIAKSARAHGAELAFTYQGDALKKRVEPLAKEVGGLVVGHCDVTDPASIDAVFAATATHWPTIDFLVHCLAFADHTYLKKEYGNFTSTPRQVYTQAVDISAYSLIALTRACRMWRARQGGRRS